MTSRRRPRATGALLLAVVLASCGRYAELAQKLDVTARIAGDTWIAAGATRLETRILLVGAPDANGVAPFQFTSVSAPLHADGTAGRAVTSYQGTWSETGSGDATLRVAHTYELLDESDRAILSRLGSRRSDDARTLRVAVARVADRLVVTGDPGLAGTYVGLTAALRNLGPAATADPTCAYQVFSLAIQSSEARIIGFNSPTMARDYGRAEAFVGAIAGSLQIRVSGNTTLTTRIDYAGFQDQGGVVVNGPQVTTSDWGGNGRMEGVMTFAISPHATDPAAAPPLTGTIDYGGAGNPADAVQISSGNTSGGYYVATIEGGATARVSAVAPSSPSPADCLALP